MSIVDAKCQFNKETLHVVLQSILRGIPYSHLVQRSILDTLAQKANLWATGELTFCVNM